MNDRCEHPEERQQPTDGAREQPTTEQDELYARYLEQQRRLSCPGCGEADQYF